MTEEKGAFRPQEAGSIPSRALADIAAERQRQVAVEGWSLLHDDGNRECEMSRAAACYALAASGFSAPAVRELWPREWSFGWWKPKGRRRDLVRAGALIVAEIERLDRASTAPSQAPSGDEGRQAGVDS